MKKYLKLILIGILLFMVGCSSSNIEECDKYDEEFKKAIQLVDNSDDDSIFQNTVDAIEVMLDNFNLLIDFYENGNKKGFNTMAININTNCNEFFKVILKKEKNIQDILTLGSAAEYNKALIKSIDSAIALSGEMMKVEDIRTYELNEEKSSLMVERTQKFLDLLDSGLNYSDTYLNKDNISNNNTEYAHSETWNSLNLTMDKEMIELFEGKFIDEYDRQAGENRNWDEYIEMSKDNKLELLNKGAKALISIYAINTEPLTEDEVFYLEEFADCTFTRLLGNEYNESIYCKDHK